MPKRSSKDINQTAFSVVQQSLSNSEAASLPPVQPKNTAAVERLISRRTQSEARQTNGTIFQSVETAAEAIIAELRPGRPGTVVDAIRNAIRKTEGKPFSLHHIVQIMDRDQPRHGIKRK